MADATTVSNTPITLLEQAGLAILYYACLILIMRLAGKRLAGQTTTFDLIVLITLGVVLQGAVLREGNANAIVFVVTTFGAHKLNALLCFHSRRFRHFVRGAPRPLVRDGVVLRDALADENLSLSELLAGLRKLGYEDPGEVKLATLEETGHVSVAGGRDKDTSTRG